MMVDVGLAVVGGILYLTGLYGLALVLIALAIVSGAGAAIKSVLNPGWYNEKRAQAELGVDFFSNRHIVSLVVTKVIVIALLLWAAKHVAEKGGYI